MNLGPLRRWAEDGGALGDHTRLPGGERMERVGKKDGVQVGGRFRWDEGGRGIQMGYRWKGDSHGVQVGRDSDGVQVGMGFRWRGTQVEEMRISAGCENI